MRDRAPFGYIPGANWTKVLCDGVARLLAEEGVTVRLNTTVSRLVTGGGRVREAELSTGERIGGDVFVSTIPTELYLRLLPGDRTPEIERIRYSALISVVCATHQPVDPRAYWINLASLDRTACGIFLLSSLNPSIGRPGDSCVNFVTHLRGRDRPLFHATGRGAGGALPGRLPGGVRLRPRAVLDPGVAGCRCTRRCSGAASGTRRSGAPRGRTCTSAGNYRTFPSIVSTGTALGSGLETGCRGARRTWARRTDLPAQASGFRLAAMPRA